MRKSPPKPPKYPPDKWRLHPDPEKWTGYVGTGTILLYRSPLVPSGKYTIWFSDVVVARKVQEWNNEWCDLCLEARRLLVRVD